MLEYTHGAEHLSFDEAPPPPPYSIGLPADKQGQILFTGFKAGHRTELEELAVSNGLQVVKIPTKNLAFLCAGYNAGWTKIKSTVEKGTFIFSETQLVATFETGCISEMDVYKLKSKVVVDFYTYGYSS